MSEKVKLGWYVLPFEVLDVPTVYRLYQGRELKYVGMSMLGMSRVLRQIRTYSPDRVVCLCFPGADRPYLLSVESAFIAYLRPVLNNKSNLGKHKKSKKARQALREIFQAGPYFRYAMVFDEFMFLHLYGNRGISAWAEAVVDDAKRELGKWGEKIRAREREFANMGQRILDLRQEMDRIQAASSYLKNHTALTHRDLLADLIIAIQEKELSQAR